MSDSPTTYGPPLPTAAEILHVPGYLGPFNAGWKIVDSISPRSRHYTSELRALRDAERFGHSPLAAAPPAVRANYTPAQRLELANYCGPDDARTCPMDTGKDHAPAGNVHRVRTRTGRRGWILTSTATGELALVQPRRAPGETRRPWSAWHPSHELRLGWTA